jgi:FtsZ-binding cell division protein ZapB
MALPESEGLEADSLDSLEDRIRRTVEVVTSLKAERDAAVKELEAAQATIQELAVVKKQAAEASSLRQELDALRAERKQVRVRIEKLLGQMDQVSGK